jgi:chaperonin GroES
MSEEPHTMAKDKEARIRPLDDRVVIEPLEEEQKTAGGILLPDTAKQKPQRGRVVAVGPGKMNDKGQRTHPAVLVGDVVLFGRYAGNDVQVDTKELKIMRESDILAKVVR